MVTVLVTGASGTLGSQVVQRLVARGHHVRAVTHRNLLAAPTGVESIEADVRTGRGLIEAADGANVIVHAATSVQKRARETELSGARIIVEIARNSGAHLIYPSIVGVDRIGGSYYLAKRDAEEIIAGAPVWTIQRATQFHMTLDRVLGNRVFPRTAHLSFQPVDAGEVADEIVSIAEQGPRGRAEDFGGPEVLALRDLVAARSSIIGKRTLLPRFPALGPFRELDRGANLCPAHARGTISWEDWLKKSHPDARDVGHAS